MDITALQETRLLESGIIRQRDYSFFWQGKAADETREHGVGFAIKNNLLGSLISPSEGTERLLKLQLQTSAGLVSLISAYAPTLTSASELKDRLMTTLVLPSVKFHRKILCSSSVTSMPGLVLTTALGQLVWATLWNRKYE